jgi:hypothetical protein
VDGEEFGQHGRIHNAPAENVGIYAAWEEDEYILRVRGTMREAVLYNENLRLTRTIETKLGASSFLLTDEIENLAFRDEPLMILYHANFGYPLVDETAVVYHPAGEIVNRPLDGRPLRWREELGALDAPSPMGRGGYHLRFDEETVCLGIRNDALEGFRGVYMRYRKSQLPCYGLWRNLTEGDYVVGLEPGTAYTVGREKALAGGALPVLKPMEKYTISLEFGVER